MTRQVSQADSPSRGFYHTYKSQSHSVCVESQISLFVKAVTPVTETEKRSAVTPVTPVTPVTFLGSPIPHPHKLRSRKFAEARVAGRRSVEIETAPAVRRRGHLRSPAKPFPATLDQEHSREAKTQYRRSLSGKLLRPQAWEGHLHPWQPGRGDHGQPMSENPRKCEIHHQPVGGFYQVIGKAGLKGGYEDTVARKRSKNARFF